MTHKTDKCKSMDGLGCREKQALGYILRNFLLAPSLICFLLGWLFLKQRLMLSSIWGVVDKKATRSAGVPFYQFSNLAEDSVSFLKVPEKVPVRNLTQLS